MKTTLRALAYAALITPLLLATAAPAIAADKAGHGDHAAMKEPATGSATIGDLVIDTAWTRQTPPGAKVGGGYLTVTNNGTTPDRLIGGSAGFAARVEIHEMSVTDGVMRMAELADGLPIAPGETVELKPGGFHMMFMGLTASPTMGDTVPVTLVFAEAGEVTVQMPVAAVGASSPGGSAGEMKHSGHGDHGTMKHGD